jgi:uncharacterized protein DUF2795
MPESSPIGSSSRDGARPCRALTSYPWLAPAALRNGPAEKRLAGHAERNGADRELVQALRAMNKDCFDGPNAVMKELKGSLTGSRD